MKTSCCKQILFVCQSEPQATTGSVRNEASFDNTWCAARRRSITTTSLLPVHRTELVTNERPGTTDSQEQLAAVLSLPNSFSAGLLPRPRTDDEIAKIILRSFFFFFNFLNCRQREVNMNFTSAAEATTVSAKLAKLASQRIKIYFSSGVVKFESW
jgi:hypothetical protein